MGDERTKSTVVARLCFDKREREDPKQNGSWHCGFGPIVAAGATDGALARENDSAMGCRAQHDEVHACHKRSTTQPSSAVSSGRISVHVCHMLPPFRTTGRGARVEPQLLRLTKLADTLSAFTCTKRVDVRTRRLLLLM